MTGDAIRELDAATVDRIAAGEVVERPASAVKELVENSLDAGADRIEVAVEGDGTGSIRVVDDGAGMSEAAVRKAVRKHTTSKIRDIEDLEAGVGTLGFRGEALATIGAVSRTTITTRPRDEGETATRLRLEGGEVTDVSPAGRAPGTTVAVEDLFFNTPARRKYLKTEATEFARVNRVVTRYALANPDVAVSLEHDGREVFATTGQGDLQGAIMSVYGRDVAESMVRVEGGDGPLDRVWGYVSDPETTRSTRAYLSTFVNGRYVEESVLREAIVAAYGRQLAPDRFPFAVVFVDLPADGVDVNVHPRKMAVRFDDEEGVRDALRGAIEDALLEAGLVRHSAPRGRSAPGDAPISPERADDARDPDDSTGEPGASTAEREGDAPPATDRGESSAGGAPGETTPRPAAADADPASGPEATTGAADADESTTGATPATTESSAGDATPPRDPSDDEGRASARESGDRSRPDDATERKFRPGTTNARLPGTDGAEASDTQTFDRLPSMRVLGQFRETYVVAETEDGLVLVDQHAADERVNYERLRERATGDGGSQALVSPVELELTAGEAAAFDAVVEDLRDLGFEADLDGRTARVRAVPAPLSAVLDPDLVRDTLAALVEGGDGDATVGDAADELFADMACHPSVTGNTSLSEGAVVDLLAALDDCENPYACPHGRPTVIELSEDEIADRFERDYPGHATRRPEGGPNS